MEKIDSILVVDDTPHNLKVLYDLLGDAGYKVRVASNGSDTLETVAKALPDLILLDIKMPDMDGFAVCRQLKEDAASRDIPVIFISALNDVQDKVNAFRNGGVDYITKPFLAEEVLARVAAHLEINRQKIELMELNTTKDKFFSIIAHDLKNPFAGVMGAVEVLEGEVRKSGGGEEYGKYFEIINSTAINTMALLENLLEWARSNLGHLEFRMQKVNLKQLTTVCFDVVSPRATDKNIELKMDLPEGISCTADEHVVMTVLRNLLTNAIKFTPDGGTVTVQAEKKDGMIELSVADTGIGMSEDELAKLFHLELKFKKSGTRQEMGTGLGLHLCKEFMEKNGGTISVASEEGKGSVFTVRLPE